MKKFLLKSMSNLPGWRTNRKIVVIESDDWGSIRMSSGFAFEELIRKGFPIRNDHFNQYDALERNEDMEGLISVLSSHKDSTGRPPVITGLNIVANPNFELIKENGFDKYYYESVNETYKQHSKHSRVSDLWKESIKNRLIVPEFHGREHLNVQFWMEDLKMNKEYTKIAFENRVTGIPPVFNGNEIRDYQAAFDVEVVSDISKQAQIIVDGINLFHQIHGYVPKFFVPPNGPFNTSLESVAYKAGIRYLGIPKLHVEPLGNNKYKKHLRFIGKRGKSNLLYLTRNAFFEPSSTYLKGEKNWVNSCMFDIEMAFKMKKPAIISTHRVNYIGDLNQGNRTNSLIALNTLFKNIVQKWPQIEFLTSSELGEAIEQTKK